MPAAESEDSTDEWVADGDSDVDADEWAGDTESNYAPSEQALRAAERQAMDAPKDVSDPTPMTPDAARCLNEALPALLSDESLVELRRPQRIPFVDAYTGERTFPARMLAQGLVVDRDSEGRALLKLGVIELVAAEGKAVQVGFQPARSGYPSLAYPECGAADCRDIRLVFRGRTIETMSRSMELLDHWTVEGTTVSIDPPICAVTAQSAAGTKIVPLKVATALLVAWARQTMR